MGLFEKIFGRVKPSSNEKVRFEMLSDDSGGFYSWNGNVYQSDIVKACIRPKAKAVGKLIAKHIRDNSIEFKVNPNASIRMLLEEPNPIMTGQVMQEKLAIQLELNNNAFAYIKRDDLGFATQIYPISCVSVEVVEGVLGDIYLRFYFANGKRMVVPYDDVIHLRKDFNNDDFFGEHPGRSLAPLMEIVNTTDQGIIKAIKNSNAIKWLLKFAQTLRPEDIQKETKRFEENFLSSTSSTTTVAGVDAKAEAIQIKPNDYVPNENQMDKTIQRIYSFFNTNVNIVQSKYTEDEWNAYYEAEIEPLAMQLAGEYTRKLFSRKERGFGNKIIFEASSLQYASMSTKMNLVQMVDRGALTPNEWRSILSLGPIEGGDKPVRRLDTALVDNGNVVKGGEKDEQDGNSESSDE